MAAKRGDPIAGINCHGEMIIKYKYTRQQIYITDVCSVTPDFYFSQQTSKYPDNSSLPSSFFFQVPLARIKFYVMSQDFPLPK